MYIGDDDDDDDDNDGMGVARTRQIAHYMYDS